MMSYEYKDYFKELHFNESRKVGSDLNDRFNVRDELNEVYRKAKAFDAILKAYDEAFSREHMAGEVSNIIEKYESGDYDAKK